MDNKATQLETQKVPDLRFSSFSGEWKEKKLGEVFNFLPTNSLSRSQLTYTDGNTKNIHYGDIHTKFKQGFYIKDEEVPFIKKTIDNSKTKKESYCKEGDLVIADTSEDYKDIGKTIELIDLKNHKIVAGLHTFLLRKKEQNDFVKGFPGYLIKTDVVRKQIMKMATGISVLGISKGNLAKVELCFPTTLEQQKIAKFLESTDKWIENLKTQKEFFESYKKGMMQKIFSQEIRFKDDKGNQFPKWEEKKLGEVGEFWNGKAHEQDISVNGKYIVVNSKFISQNGEVKKYSDKQTSPLRKGDIAIVMSDIPNGKAIGKCFLINRDDTYTLNQRIGGIKSKKIMSSFLIRLLNRNKYFLKFDNGVSQTNLRKDEVIECPVIFPSIPEQKKIAIFLTSIDEVIESKQQQIDLAKSWKKGLMQRMFV